MILNIGNCEFELKTTLGVAKRIEESTKKTITEVMAELYKSATVKDMLTLLKSALAEKSNPGIFESVVLENMDFTTLRSTCEELLLNISFGGTPEEQEQKISDFPASTLYKNKMRRVLNLPIPETPLTSEKSSEQPTE